MENSRLSYVYRISFEDGSWYWGSRICPAGVLPEDDRYTGSPVTHKAKWTTDPFTKEIIEVFSEHAEASAFECSLIVEDMGKDLCLNENAAGRFSLEACSIGGKKAAEKTKGKKREPEIGRKISASKKGKKLSEAHIQALRDCPRPPISAEAIAKIQAAREGYVHSEETKSKIGKGNLGKVRTTEQKARLSAAMTGSKLSASHKESIRQGQLGKVWWTNGERTTKSFECPGEGWVRGMKLKRASWPKA